MPSLNRQLQPVSREPQPNLPSRGRELHSPEYTKEEKKGPAGAMRSAMPAVPFPRRGSAGACAAEGRAESVRAHASRGAPAPPRGLFEFAQRHSKPIPWAGDYFIAGFSLILFCGHY